MVFVLTIDDWIKAFPGVMAVATVNSLITISSGHATGNPSVLIPRSTAILATLLLAGGTALSVTFRTKRVSVPDRIALLALAVSIGWGAVDVRHWLPALAGRVAFSWRGSMTAADPRRGGKKGRA